ncbi:MAG: hypothetical protein Q9161_007926 [Pseudevernia consocians]
MSSRSKFLQSRFAFHSAQMEIILEDLEEAALGVKYLKPIFPIASALLGRLVTNEGIFNAEYILRQTRETVDFFNAINKCMKSFDVTEGIIWIEIGPNPHCLRMVSAITGANDSELVASLDKGEDNWTTITKGLAKVYTAGADIAWSEYHNAFRDSLNLLGLPTYAFDLKSHWLQYEGDWCITKNQSTADSIKTGTSAMLHSTTLHSVAETRQSEGMSSIEFTSDLADKNLSSIIGGHNVDGVGLCPSSVYADMAMTAASQLCERPGTSSPNLSIEVPNLKILRPLKLQVHTASQVIYVSARSVSNFDKVNLSIESRGGQGTEVHAQCAVSWTSTAVLRETWECNAYIIRSRIQSLMTAASLGTAHRILQGMVYKLFSSLVSYYLPFQCMKEDFLDSKAIEAAALIELQPTEVGEQFFCNPHWIDGLAHLSGFVLNGSDTSPEDTVFISDGWKCLRLILPLESGKRYQTYVRMRDAKAPGTMEGDVWVFDGAATVGVFEGLRFRAVKRTMLPALLSKKDLPQEVTDSQTVCNLHRPALRDTGTLCFDIANIVADELGTTPKELLDEMCLGELGIDSLLAVSISSRLQKTLHLDCPSSSITECETIGQLKKILEACSTVWSSEMPSKSTPPTNKDNSDQNLLPNSLTTGESIDLGKAPDITKIFYRVLADELDVDMQKLHPGIHFSDLGMLNLQPEGPYLLGGWSIGGVYAYEATAQLLQLGKQVKGLILLDAACPTTLPPLPMDTFDLLEGLGVFDQVKRRDTDGRVSTNTLKHFASSIGALKNYSIEPLPQTKPTQPICRIIWARYGVLEGLSTDKREGFLATHSHDVANFDKIQRWLMASREDFSPNGWDQLVTTEIKCSIVDGDHFSMMRHPKLLYTSPSLIITGKISGFSGQGD